MAGAGPAMCPVNKVCFTNPADGVEACSTTVASATWQVPSVTGPYTVTGRVTFHNSGTEVSKSTTMQWEQGC